MDLRRTSVPPCLLLLGIIVVVVTCHNYTKEMVQIRPHTDIKYFVLPTSDDPLAVWMDIEKGIYPNISHIQTSLEVGEQVTILIYLKDTSNLYDIMVNDCWAHDKQNFEFSKHKLHLTSDLTEHSNSSKSINKWYKKDNIPGNDFKRVLYTNFTSFKFPDRDQIYLKCDIQLCFKSCTKLAKKLN